MKYLILVFCFFMSFSSFSMVDEYVFCQVQMESIRILSKIKVDVLEEYRSSILKSKTIDEIKKNHEILIFIGVDDKSNKNEDVFLNSIVNQIKSNKGLSKEEAEIEALRLIKYLKLNEINQAIKFNGIDNPVLWSDWVEQCVKSNKDFNNENK